MGPIWAPSGCAPGKKGRFKGGGGGDIGGVAEGRGGAEDGGRGGVLLSGDQRRGAAAMLTKKPGASVLPTGKHSFCSRRSGL